VAFCVVLMGVAEGFELEVYVLDRLFQLPSHSCSTEIWELYMFRRPMNHKVNIFLFLVLRQRLAQDIRFFWRSRDVDFLPIWSEEMAEAFACMVEVVSMLCMRRRCGCRNSSRRSATN